MTTKHNIYLSFLLLCLYSCHLQQPSSNPYHKPARFSEKATKKLLYIASKEGSTFNVKKVETLIRKGADVNATDSDGKNLLHLVRDVRLANIFIEAGTDVNAKDKAGNTPIVPPLP